MPLVSLHPTLTFLISNNVHSKIWSYNLQPKREFLTFSATFFSLFIALNCFILVKTAISRGLSEAPSSRIHGWSALHGNFSLIKPPPFTRQRNLKQNYGQHVFKEWLAGRSRNEDNISSSQCIKPSSANIWFIIIQSYFYRGDGLGHLDQATTSKDARFLTNNNVNKHMELCAIITPNHEPWHKLWGVRIVGSFSFPSYFFSFARRAYETGNKIT